MHKVPILWVETNKGPYRQLPKLERNQIIRRQNYVEVTLFRQLLST